MKTYLNSAGCPFDFILFTNYERQVAALMAGHVDIAWNGPVAHVLAQQHAGPQGLISLGMRDVDCDFRSICVARKDAQVSSVSELSGKIVGTGAHDSPQAHLVPLHWLGELGVKPKEVKSFDLDLGKHGDTAVGEVKAIEALLEGQVDAGLVSKMMWDRAVDGQLPSIDKGQLQNLAVLPEEGYVVVSKALASQTSKRHFSTSTSSTGRATAFTSFRPSLGHLTRGVRSFGSKPTVGVVGARDEDISTLLSFCL
eukprot:Skav217545  [mRNA]  locus=scaffold4393:31573:32672:- [translate_table: standard]